MAGKSIKLAAKGVALVIGCALLILLAELIRAVFFQDFSHLVIQRNCEGRLCDLVDATRRADQTFDPAAIPPGHNYVLFMSEEDAESVDDEVRVAAADAQLFHTRQGPFGLPVRFAVVVTTTGTPLTWQGDEEDYATAVENALSSPTGRVPDVFWEKAMNRSSVMSDLQRENR